MQGRKRTKRGLAGKKRGKRSASSKWIAALLKLSGVFDASTKEGRALLILWEGIPPPRVPKPLGPTKGAQLTFVQYTNSFNVETNVSNATITQNSATALLGSIAFTLNDLSQVTSWTTVFDQYRIDEVHFRCTSRSNSVSVFTSSATTEAVPYVQFVVDRDDSTAPASLAAVGDYDNMLQMPGWGNLDVVIQPSVSPAVYASGAFSGYEIRKAGTMWLDCANAAIPHYGIKFGVSALDVSTTADWKFDVAAWYKVSFKNVR
jgi:hypothetical protein